MWHVEFDRGGAGEFHLRDVPPNVEPTVWWFEVDRPALVIGSAQPITDIDETECARRGIEVVRRRSGGGAVLLEPDDALWVDILISSRHALWTPDVTSSAFWLGQIWQQTLSSLGMTGTQVHRGPMQRSTWSRLVCFAGVGGGEVLLGHRKVVGISQRRTRDAARFQCALYSAWRPEAHVPLFTAHELTADELGDLVAPVNVAFADIRRAFSDALAALGD
jgi:lipoate-protein ligase A